MSLDQVAFLKGRNIAENSLIVQEILHSMNRKKGTSGLMMMKMDQEKANDRLRWDFIGKSSHQIQINASWINYIMQCINSI